MKRSFWGESGAGTVLALAIVCACVAGLGASELLVFGLSEHRKLQVSADQIAVAVADSVRGLNTANGCELAGQLAHFYMVSIESCRIVGFESFIKVRSEPLGIVLSATARAGPG